MLTLLLASAALVLLVAWFWSAPVEIAIRGRLAGRVLEVTPVVRYPGGLRVGASCTWALAGYDLSPPCLRVVVGAEPPGRSAGRREEVRTWCLEDLVRRAERLRQEAFPGGWPWSMAGRWRIERLSLRMVVGAGDAAATALACGALLASLGGALAALQDRWAFASPPRVAVTPDFRGRGLSGEGECIARLRGGDIMHAGWLAFRERLFRPHVKRTAPPGAAGPAHVVEGGRRWSTPSRA